jgi:hypothetical protein
MRRFFPPPFFKNKNGGGRRGYEPPSYQTEAEAKLWQVLHSHQLLDDPSGNPIELFEPPRK